MNFVLSPVLETGSTHVQTHGGKTGSFQFRLSNDARFFWVLIIPEQNDIIELHDMSDDAAAELFSLARNLGAHISSALGATKINTGSIGNVVPQLHYHVVARFEDDDAWPAPVWGHGSPQEPSAELVRERSLIIENYLHNLTL